jgi:hypothetical protein
MEGCCSIENAPSILASIVAAVIGLCLLTKTLDDWQLARVRRRNRQAAGVGRSNANGSD